LTAIPAAATPLLTG
jgi:HK97 family phage prohead protease